jgi:hypothetical protein
MMIFPALTRTSIIVVVHCRAPVTEDPCVYKRSTLIRSGSLGQLWFLDRPPGEPCPCQKQVCQIAIRLCLVLPLVLFDPTSSVIGTVVNRSRVLRGPSHCTVNLSPCGNKVSGITVVLSAHPSFASSITFPAQTYVAEAPVRKTSRLSWCVGKLDHNGGE